MDSGEANKQYERFARELTHELSKRPDMQIKDYDTVTLHFHFVDILYTMPFNIHLLMFYIFGYIYKVFFPIAAHDHYYIFAFDLKEPALDILDNSKTGPITKYEPHRSNMVCIFQITYQLLYTIHDYTWFH